MLNLKHMNKIREYCSSLARQGLRGHELLRKTDEHFRKPYALVGLLMDGNEVSRAMIDAMHECIKREIFTAVVIQTHRD